MDLERAEVNEKNEWDYEICGNVTMISKKHYSSERSMILEFHTDNLQGNHTGFRGIFKFLDKGKFSVHVIILLISHTICTCTSTCISYHSAFINIQ